MNQQNFLYFLILSLLIIISVISAPLSKVKPVQIHQKQAVLSPEIIALKKTKDLKEQTKLYIELINKEGPVQAQEELFKSGLPFDGQTHLLNHTVGDWLYEKYGDWGLTYCRDYFLSSCYHGFVIREIAKGGLNSLSLVMDICWKQGAPTATQCAHAIGHGLLVYDGYRNLPTALKDCDKVSQISNNFPLYNCHDGVFMENVWAIHEGKPSFDQWVSKTDYLYPCNDWRIKETYLAACWSNQPSRMYMMFGGDIEKIGKVCLTLNDEKLKSTCFDALARQIHPVTQGSADETFKLCGKMPKEWENYCVSSVSRSAFSVGDHVNVPYELCLRIKEDGKEGCYQNLFSAIYSYGKTQEEKRGFCQKISEPYWEVRCLGQI